MLQNNSNYKVRVNPKTGNLILEINSPYSPAEYYENLVRSLLDLVSNQDQETPLPEQTFNILCFLRDISLDFDQIKKALS